MLSRAALIGIAGYQRWLSPRKGYACAYRMVHGGTGCSGHAKAAIRDHGLWAALPLIRARLAACGEAAALLRQRAGTQDKDRRKKGHWADGCDCSPCCGPRGGHLDGCDIDGCDCSP